MNAKGKLGPLDQMAPCGCVLVVKIIKGKKSVTLVPCDINCPVVQASMDVAQAEGKEVNLVGGKWA
jgi:hypothetical protein